MAKVLLVTFFPPDYKTGGAVIARFLAEHFSANELRWFSLSHPKTKLAAHVDRLFVGSMEFRPVGGVRLKLARFWEWWFCHAWSRLAARKIEKMVSAIGADRVWFVLDYMMVPIASRLVERNHRLRFHFSVHDHPAQIALTLGLSAKLRAAIDAGLDVITKASASFDAVSEELLADMNVMVKQHTLTTLGCHSSRLASSIDPPSQVGPLRMAYAGSYLSPDVAECLTGGLEKWAADSGRKWEIHLFADKVYGELPPKVTVHCWLDPENLVAELRQMDFLLIALSLRPEAAKQMRTSLPTKLVSYLEVGRLIVAYVPAGSATARLVADHYLGPIITVPDPKRVVAAINEGLKWNLEAANEGRLRIVGDRFSPGRIVSGLRSTLLAR